MPHARFAAAAVVLTALPTAQAAPAPVELASCGASRLELVLGADGRTGELRAQLAGRPGWTAKVGTARVGGRTRTVIVEDLVAKPAGKPLPSQVFVDLLLDDSKVIFRHASEGGTDPEYVLDLDKCTFGKDGDMALAGLVEAVVEAPGCTALDAYRDRVAKAAKLADADLKREAMALCTDHQQTIASRARLEQVISDRAARARIKARRAAIGRTEEARVQTWTRIDGCLGDASKPAASVAKLHDAEAATRACYDKIAAKP